MAAADRRVEEQPGPPCVQPHTQLDVLDARLRVALGVEAAGGDELGAPHGSQAGPERLGLTGRAGVDVVMEQVAKARGEAGRRRVVVVGAEDRDQVGGEEVPLDSPEGVLVHLDVGIDEDDHIGFGLVSAGVAGRGGAAVGRVADDDQLVRRSLARLDRGQAARQRGGPVGGRHDRRNRRGVRRGE